MPVLKQWDGTQWITPVGGAVGPTGNQGPAGADGGGETHTGEVTGDTVLTVDKTAITGQSLVDAAVDDELLVTDTSDLDNLKRVTVQTIVDLAGDVVGPGASVDNTLPRFSGTTGKLLQGSLIVVDDSDNLFTPDNSGIVIGHTAQIDFGATPEFQVLGTGTSDSSMGFARFENIAAGPDVRFLKSRAAAIGDNVIVQDGDTLGRIRFQAADGGDFNTTAAQIMAQVDGTPGLNDVPGRIIFTTRIAGGSLTEKMRLNNLGYLGLNTDSPAWRMEILNTASAIDGAAIDRQNVSTVWHRASDANGQAAGFGFLVSSSGNPVIGAGIVHERTGSNSIGKMHFATKIESATGDIPIHMTISDDGNVGIGDTSPTAKLHVVGTTFLDGAVTISDGNELEIIHGGSGESTQQEAIDALTDVYSASDEQVLTRDTASGNAIFKDAAGGGSGDVVGPGSSVDNTFVRFDSTTGKLIQAGIMSEDDTGHVTIGNGAAGVDYTLTFDGETNDGLITWKEDEDYFEFADAILLSGLTRINFADTGNHISQTFAGVVELLTATKITLDSPLVSVEGELQVTGVGNNFSVSSTALFVDAANKRVGVGTQTPTLQMHLVNQGATADRGLQVDLYVTSASAGNIVFQKARGLIAAPTTVVNGDGIGQFASRGHDGTNFVGAARFIFAVDGAVSTGVMPLEIGFYSGTSGGGTKRMVVASSGRIGIGATVPVPTAQLHVDQSSSTAAIPVLTLDQADISEEMIEFVTSIGTGRAIEAVGAKSLTVTHFIKVTIPGGLTRYLEVGTIA